MAKKKLTRREAEQYLFKMTGIETTLVEEKFTYTELNELIKQLNSHGGSHNDR